MSFTPQSVKDEVVDASPYAPNVWQKRALVGMLGMVLLTFAVGNLWALLWQTSDWLTATVLPAVVVDLTNNERLAVNARPLERNALLDEAARQKAEHMATVGYFAHYSPDGVSPWHWFRQVEYQFAHAGENLAVHFTDSRAVVQAWMNSPSHRENIENNIFTEIGVGTARGTYNGHDTIFVVQMFGTPAEPAVAAVSASTPPSPPPSPVPVPIEEPLLDEVVVESSTIETDQVDSSDIVAVETDETEIETEAIAVEPEVVEDQVVGGAGADPVEVLEDRVSEVAIREEVADSDTEQTPVSTTSIPYLVQSDVVDENGSLIVDHWFTTTHATSSGLPVASTAGTTMSGLDRLNPFVAMSTQPSALVQFIYSILGLLTAGMILWAMQLEFRRHRYVQVAYSFGLLGLMSGLWYVHELVTSGAVIT